MSLQVIPILLGISGLAIAFFIYALIAKQTVNDPKVASIGKQIHIGAMRLCVVNILFLSFFLLFWLFLSGFPT